MTNPTADAIAALTQKPVRCAGCGSRWTDADLARERAANPRILSCCPERMPLTIDQWADRAETTEDALLSAQGQAGKPDAPRLAAHRVLLAHGWPSIPPEVLTEAINAAFAAR